MFAVKQSKILTKIYYRKGRK